MNKYMAAINLAGALLSVVALVKAPDGAWPALISFVTTIATSAGFVICLVEAIKETRSA